MKKLALFAAAAVSLFAVSAADAQSDTSATTSRTTAHRTTVATRNNAALNARLRRIEAQSHTITTSPQTTRIDGSVALGRPVGQSVSDD